MYNSIKNITYLGKNLTKKLQAFCINYNTLVKEIEEDMNKLKDIPCLCFE